MPSIIEDMWDNNFYPSKNGMCSNKYGARVTAEALVTGDTAKGE